MDDTSAVSEAIETPSDAGNGQEYDFDSASDQLASDMFPESNREPESTESEAIVDQPADVEQETATETTPEQTEEIEPAPKTWPTEMHEHWAKTPKEVRDYWAVREKQMLDGLEQYKEHAGFGKQMRDAVTPYAAMIQAQGVDAAGAVKALLGAHYKLSVSPPTQKAQYFAQLAQQYGIDIGSMHQGQEEQQQADPVVRQLQDQLHELQQHIQGQTQSALQSEQKRIASEVNAFASDAAHPYFDDVADDMIPFLNAGVSLQDAYEKAVWANPMTRAKEQARVLQDQQAESKRKAQEAAEAAKKATSTNIRSRDTRRTPTEPNRATMRDLDSVMRESMRELKTRTH